MGRFHHIMLALVFCLVAAGGAHAFCFEEAGAEYGINPQILRAIAKVESNFNATALNTNSNGTYDVGLMQINSSWSSSLGKERWKLLGDACYNAKTGAWILAQCMNKYGYTWKAIGCYHSQTPGLRDSYAQKVFAQLKRVAPLAQEEAYKPLKQKLEDVVQTKIDGWVEQAVKTGDSQHSEKISGKTVTAQPHGQAQATAQPAPVEEPGLQPPDASFLLPSEAAEAAAKGAGPETVPPIP